LADDFAQEVRELWRQAEEADKDNRDEAITDLEFAAPDSKKGHWDEQVRQYREQMGRDRYGFPLPCLTINDLPQKVGQVIGDRRANQTSIKVLPREDGDMKVAEVRSELIRSIELQSKADRVYMSAFDQAVTCGIGNFRVALEDAADDVFVRDLFVRAIPNPLAVLWDPLAADPTGRDASYCFVAENMPMADFKKKFPKATPSSLDAKGLEKDGWMEGETIRVAEYWRIDERKRTFAMLQGGITADVTDQPEEGWKSLVMMAGDKPMIRDGICKYAVRTLTNGQEQLEEPFELKLHRVPIIRVTGREVWVGEKRVRFGLVRYARDPARLRDYWRSLVAEKLMLSPRANFVAQAAAIKGREDDWQNTLIYNDGAQQPLPVTTNDLQAIMNEAQMCAQDMKDTTGLHDASLGIQSNETSGVAIQRRQHEGDIATIVYHDNMNSAMQEAGEVLNALIPLTYDTPRTIRTVGNDEAVKLIRVNDPNFQPSGMVKENIDIGLGKYDVTISTGPAYMTKRQEAAADMMQAVQAWPEFMKIAGDKIAIAQDWPDADEIAERVKRTMDPAILGDDADDGKDPEELAEQKAQADQAKQLQQQAAELQMRKAAAETEQAEADAEKARYDAQKAKAEALEAEAKLSLAGAHLSEMAGDLDDAADMQGIAA
jgi:hypothetical protein